MKRKEFHAWTALLALMLFSSALQSAEQNRFVRITAELSAEGIRLIETRIGSGTVRVSRLPLRENADRYLVRVYGISSEVLFEDTFRDPRKIHFDTLDFEGNLTGGVVRLEKAAFSLKLPLTNTSQRIDFFERSISVEDESENFSISGERRIGSFTLQEVRNALSQK